MARGGTIEQNSQQLIHGQRLYNEQQIANAPIRKKMNFQKMCEESSDDSTSTASSPFFLSQTDSQHSPSSGSGDEDVRSETSGSSSQSGGVALSPVRSWSQGAGGECSDESEDETQSVSSSEGGGVKLSDIYVQDQGEKKVKGEQEKGKQMAESESGGR
jgi:hypothetical protein